MRWPGRQPDSDQVEDAQQDGDRVPNRGLEGHGDQPIWNLSSIYTTSGPRGTRHRNPAATDSTGGRGTRVQVGPIKTTPPNSPNPLFKPDARGKGTTTHPRRATLGGGS